MHRQELAEALLFFVGLYVLSRVTQRWPSLRRAVCYRGSRDWPVAQATVLSQMIENRNSRLRAGYQAVVKYSYNFDGRTYYGYFKSDILYFETDAQRFLERYPAGRLMTARVNPRKPEDAVLVLAEN